MKKNKSFASELVTKFWRLLTENGSYKLVALFVTLILWVTILGRRDFTHERAMDLEFLLPPQTAVAEGVNRKVLVQVSGPRPAINKFKQSTGTILLDLGRYPHGRHRVPIPPRAVDVPFGVKILSITPDTVRVTLTPARTSDDDNE